MMPRLATAAAVLLLLPTLSHAQVPASSADSVARVDSIFAEWSAPGSPGCACAVSRGGRVLVSRAYGLAELEHEAPNTPETIFEAGSVSKQITAAAVILLAQQGKLSLDDDVRKHVPEVPSYGAPITLRHLLSHTSGLRDWGTVCEAAGQPRGSRVYTHAHVLDVIARQRALNYAPGAEYLYTNSGYSLLAITVQRVSGQTLAEFTRTQIFEPLGMARTSWRDDFTRVVKGRAQAYGRGREGFSLVMPFEHTHGHGGLLTTAGDLLRWNENLETGRVGGPALAAELQRQGVLTSGRRIAYAQGVVVGDYRGFREISHSGATAGYRAFLVRYPEPRVSVAVLCNVARANATRLARQVADVFLPPAAPASPAPEVALPAAALRARTGVYREPRSALALRVEMEGEKLAIADFGELTPLSESRFRLDEAAEVEFAPAPAGQRGVLRLIVGGDTTTFEPMPAWTPTPSELAALAGEYHGDEAEATYTAEVVEGKLVLRRRPNTTIELVPTYPGAFITPGGWMVLFARDASGRAESFGLWLDRARDLRFDRVQR
jgi:CubicO group peptidase (beta-lactamase class C family)